MSISSEKEVCSFVSLGDTSGGWDDGGEHPVVQGWVHDPDDYRGNLFNFSQCLPRKPTGTPYPDMCLALYMVASAVSFQKVGKYIFISSFELLFNYYSLAIIVSFSLLVLYYQSIIYRKLSFEIVFIIML